MKKTRTMCRYILTIALVVAAIVGIIVSIILWSGSRYGVIFETNNIADYGNIAGNIDNEHPREFVFSFFPKTIKQQFSQVNYHYKAISGDTYAYEVWLDFVIDSQFEFKTYVDSICRGKSGLPFPYDEKYYVFPISNILQIEKDEQYYWIQRAEIGKILVSESEHKIIFVALGVYDGGATTTDDLNYYWKYFNIEPYA